MASARKRLLQDLHDLEERLRSEWSREAPPLSEELQRYRQDWVQTLLAGPPRQASESDLQRALRGADPLLVGDYHALRRSRHGLRELVQSLPEDQQPGLLLELLPREVTVPAAAALRAPDLRLVDGRPLGQAFRASLQQLARRDGLVAGAWVDGPPEQRDEAAAARWGELSDAHPDCRWLLFFGDWHLAEDHLPRLLRERGARPTMLHQSPEPIWEQLSGSLEETILDLGRGHWAWLHTPPLAQWASTLQEMNQDDPEAAAEITEELVEALAQRMAQTLGLPDPGHRPSVWPTPLWTGFQATLPAAHRHALAAEQPPAATVVHPNLPVLWVKGPCSFNQLVEAAAHVLACDSPLADRGSLHGRLCARAFRRLWASLMNPFLRPPSVAEAARAWFPDPRQRPRIGSVASLLRAWGQGHEPYLSPRQRYLAIEVLGARAGTHLAENGATDHAFVQEFLKSGGRSLGWSDLTATIRAA